MAPQEPVFLTEFSATWAKPGAIRGHRSKGCITCRRRKVKCDERRPICVRCEKGFHKCQGYDKPLVFVAQKFSAPNSTCSTSPSNTSRSAKPVTPSSSSQSSKSSPVMALLDGEWTNTLPIKKKMSPARRVCRSVPLNAFKDEIVICHLLEKFSIGLGPSMAGVTDAPTMASVLTSHNANSNAYVSGLGLAEAFFAHVQKVHGMTEHASELYGQALRNLRDDLQLTDEKVARSRAYMNLWSCVFLGLYEVVAASGHSSWIQHSRGMGILTELLGPRNFQSPVANTILDMNRSFIATSYIIERKRCFLGRPEWQTVPWEQWTRPRTIISRTTDILCDIPGLMEDTDTLIQAEEQGLNTESDKLLLQDQLLQRIQRIANLVWQWDLTNPLACWEVPIDPFCSVSLNDAGQPLFDTVFHFDDVERAIDVLNLNAVRLLLYGMCDKAGLLDSYVSTIVGSQYDGPHANPLLLPGQGDRISHALEICRCVDFLLGNPRQSRGALVLLFPLRVAWTYLGPLPETSQWVGRVLKQLSTSQGLRIGEHVLDID